MYDSTSLRVAKMAEPKPRVDVPAISPEEYASKKKCNLGTLRQGIYCDVCAVVHEQPK